MERHRALAAVCTGLTGWLSEPSPARPDWEAELWRLLPLASRVHGVAPALAAALRDVDWLEPERREWLAASLDANRRRIERLHEDAAAILAGAARRGIRLLPLKGLPLTALHLEDPGLRTMADLDFLVHPEALQETSRLLVELGYEQRSRHFKHLVFARPENLAVVSRDLEHPDNPRPVEVHTACREVFGRTPVDLTEAMWATHEERELGGVRMTAPAPELLWAHLVVHAAWQFLYGGGRLVQLLDLAWLAPAVPDQQAAGERIDPRAALLVLELAQRCVPRAVDPAVLERLRREVAAPVRQLAGSLDLVNSSHLSPRTPFRARRLLRYHRGRPAELAGALRYVLLPRIEEMHINHDRLGRSWWRAVSYPALWGWHVANLTVRAGGR